MRLMANLVDGASNPEESRTASVPSWACTVSAPRIAARRVLRFTLTSKSRGVGGNATPPPVQCGARVVPARARPVPFWRHGFVRPPATRPRLFAARVPARAAFCSARTVSWTRCGFTSAAKMDSSSVTSFDFLPAESSRGALGAATTGDPSGDGSAALACEPQAVQGRREPAGLKTRRRLRTRQCAVDRASEPRQLLPGGSLNLLADLDEAVLRAGDGALH